VRVPENRQMMTTLWRNLQSHLIDVGVKLDACERLAGVGQAFETVGWGADARYEIEAEMRKLAT
jgi:hypothetical protein